MSDPIAPHPQPGVPSRPTTASSPPTNPPRRPRTAARRRPGTARPDTTASSIGDLPDQQFFPEGEEFDEDEEFDDEEEEEDVFAFERPVTGAVPRVAFSEMTDSPPATGDLPKTADTGYTGTTALSGYTGGQSSEAGPSGTSGFGSPVPETTGNMDVGGHLPELYYDKANPPPFSGRENLNNSSFAFVNKMNQERAAAKGNDRPPTGRSLLSRLQRRRAGTATTEGTDAMTTTATTTDLTTTDYDSRAGDSDAGSFTTELTSSARPGLSKRQRSSAPLIPGTSSSKSDFSSDPSSTPRRGMSRGSYGMTEISGDMTVPDGKTTWGDGMGGMIKEGSEGESVGGMEYDLAEEDSPFPEVRASVSNIDDPEMPGTLRVMSLDAKLTSSVDDSVLVLGNVLGHSVYSRQHVLLLSNTSAVHLAICHSSHRVSVGQIRCMGDTHPDIHTTFVARWARFQLQPRSLQYQRTHGDRNHGQCRRRSGLWALRRGIVRVVVWTRLWSMVQHLVHFVDANYRILICWIMSTVRRLASIDDLAVGFGGRYQFEYPARGR